MFMTTGEIKAAPGLNVLYRDHGDWLTGWLRRQTGCSQRAEDLRQDTFVRLLTKPELPATVSYTHLTLPTTPYV